MALELPWQPCCSSVSPPHPSHAGFTRKVIGAAGVYGLVAGGKACVRNATCRGMMTKQASKGLRYGAAKLAPKAATLSRNAGKLAHQRIAQGAAIAGVGASSASEQMNRMIERVRQGSPSAVSYDTIADAFPDMKDRFKPAQKPKLLPQSQQLSGVVNEPPILKGPSIQRPVTGITTEGRTRAETPGTVPASSSSRIERPTSTAPSYQDKAPTTAGGGMTKDYNAGKGVDYEIIDQRRWTKGKAIANTEKLPVIASGQEWLVPDSHGIPIPRQVAERLQGREFSTFDGLRQAIWKEIAKDNALTGGIDRNTILQMKNGKAPPAPNELCCGEFRSSYELHHVSSIKDNGGVYDLNNLVILPPKPHIALHKKTK